MNTYGDEQMNHDNSARQQALMLTSTENASADGESTNTLTATLTDGSTLVPGERIIFTADSGSDAFFPLSGSYVVSANTNSQGKAVAYLACTTPGTVTVSAILASDSTVIATANSTFGEGGSTGDLEAPSVDEAISGYIPANTPTLALRIPAWSTMASDDQISYFWQATSAAGFSNTLHDGFPLVSADVGKDVVFDLNPELAVAPYDGGTVEAWYRVTPAGSSSGEDSAHAIWPVGNEKALPAPEVEEASGENIELAEVSDTIHADLKWLAMAVNDRVALYWKGTDAGGNAGAEQQVASHRVTENDVAVGKVIVPLSVATWLAPYEGGCVELFYTLNRADGSATEKSDMVVYGVVAEVSAGDLWVVGARMNQVLVAGGTSHSLAALDKNTRQPLMATWQYEGESLIVTGTRFTDTRPERVLVVRAGQDTERLRSINLDAVGDIAGNPTANSYTVCLNSHKLVGWGDSASPAHTVPPAIAQLQDISCVFSSFYAFAALRADGSVVAWGDSSYGGDASSVATLRDIVSVTGSDGAFAALRADGSVVAWGSSNYGGDASSVATLRNIVSITGSERAFAALRADSSVVAWGDSHYGGDASSVATLRNIVSVAGTRNAFAALRANGSVVAWGDSSYGGDASSVSALQDIVSVVESSRAFAAMRENGSVVAWGNSNYGGDASSVTGLTDIISITGNSHAFTALRVDGSIVAWGDSDYGGNIPPQIATLRDIVNISGNGRAFAALRSDGSVVAWGDSTTGGSLPPEISALRDVRAIYRAPDGFFALTDDSYLYNWGAISVATPESVEGNMSYLMS